MGGNVDGDTVMLDKVGAMGLAYLDLWQLEKAEAFTAGAIKIAETLLLLQLADGRWQNRVEPATGKVVQDYTSSQIFNIELMDRLHAITGDPRYGESSRHALRWLLDHPVQTYRWTGYYEDVTPDQESIGNWDRAVRKWVAIDTDSVFVSARAFSRVAAAADRVNVLIQKNNRLLWQSTVTNCQSSAQSVSYGKWLTVNRGDAITLEIAPLAASSTNANTYFRPTIWFQRGSADAEAKRLRPTVSR